MSKVSIIVPVHNAAQYVEATLASIFSQSHSDYEVLLVDDGSTDGSGAIIDSYADQYENVKVFHKPCGGVSSARNLALDNISSDSRYVFFIDSDDMLPAGSLLKLVSSMEEYPGAVMAFGALGLFTDQMSLDITPYAKIPCRHSVRTTRESLGDLLHAKTLMTQRYLCNRIFRTDIIRECGLRFDESIHYKEDGLFIVQYLLNSSGQVLYLSDMVYLYRQIPTSATGSLSCHHSRRHYRKSALKDGSASVSTPAPATWNPRILTNLDAHGRILDELHAHHVSRRLILHEIHNTLSCRRWILRRVIGHNAGRRRANLVSLLKISRPVITSLF